MMTDEDKFTLWVGSFRYYCGRMTYAVVDFCELLCREWPNLPESIQNLIHSELEERFDSDDRIRPYDEYAPLGMYCDRKAWEKVRALWTSSNEN